MIAVRISEANRKRMPANVSGGRSCKPSLMKSQVDPQMPQRISQTTRAFMKRVVREAQRMVKRRSRLFEFVCSRQLTTRLCFAEQTHHSPLHPGNQNAV